MSANTPLLDNSIEPDVDEATPTQASKVPEPQTKRPPVILTPTNNASNSNGGMATSASDAEAGIAGIFRQSAHPLALGVLYSFRILAIVVYLLCEWLTNNYVLSTVLVVFLLAADFWNCRNVAGRRLVGLRYWNQVDEDGESYWVFESRDPSRPANPIDSRMFWTAVYVFPILWVIFLILAIATLKFVYIPIVILAIVFNFTNAIGFTYADRDAKQRWANQVTGGAWGMGNLGSQVIGSVVKSSVGRVFGG